MSKSKADAYLRSDPCRGLKDINSSGNKEARGEGHAGRRRFQQKHSSIQPLLRRMDSSLLKDEEKHRNDTTFGAGGLFLVAGQKQQHLSCKMIFLFSQVGSPAGK